MTGGGVSLLLARLSAVESKQWASHSFTGTTTNGCQACTTHKQPRIKYHRCMIMMVYYLFMAVSLLIYYVINSKLERERELWGG